MDMEDIEKIQIEGLDHLSLGYKSSTTGTICDNGSMTSESTSSQLRV
jgi:hypothetical protein